MRSITKKRAKRLLPKALKRYRKLNDKVAVVRKRNANDHRLPENRLAKLKAARQAAAKQAGAARLAELAKQAAEAKSKAEAAEPVAT